jgi:hypothetical protein
VGVDGERSFDPVDKRQLVETSMQSWNREHRRSAWR